MISLRLSLAELRQHPTRLAAIVVAVAISVAFMVTSFGVVQTEFHHVGASLGARYADSDLVINNYGTDPDELVAAVEETSGVALVEPVWGSAATVSSADSTTSAEVQSVSAEPRLQPATLGEGRWPSSTAELVLDAGTADALGSGVGSTLEVSGSGEADNTQTMQVVGVTAPVGGLLASSYPLLYTVSDWFTQSETGDVPSSYLVLAEAGVDPQSLLTPLNDAVAPIIDNPEEQGFDVQTTDQVVADTVDSISQGADVLTVLLLVFASIAMLVGALIIANTFAIVIVQRRRQIGLLRAVGGSTAQLRQGLLAEALVIGLVGSGLGIALGVGVTALAATLTGSIGSGLVLAVPAVLASAAAGVVVTLLASLASIGRAASIAPMEALRPVTTPAQGRRATVVRIVVCGFFAVLGAALSVLSLTVPTGGDGLPAEAVLLLAIGGATALTLAVLGGAQLYVPRLLGAVGQLNRLFGPVGRMANASMVRNPQRVAATCVALMLAVGLTVTLQVGAATTQQTLLADIEQRYPVDVSLSDDSGTDIEPATLRELEQVEGVSSSMVVSAVGASVESPTQGPGYHTVYGIDPAQADAYLPEPLPDLDDASVIVSPGAGYESGDQIGLTVSVLDEEGEVVSSETTELTAQLSHGAHGSALVTTDTFAALAGGTNTAGIWLDVAAGADTQQVSTDISTIVDGSGTFLADSGSMSEVTAITQVLDALVLIATALLGAAVLIALVGVGNTLGLSVIERTRESALMRALGLQRGQLRLMLLLEAVTLAVGGALVGVLAGAFFGWLGASSLMETLGQPGGVQLAVSWPQTLGVFGVAVLAAAVASVLPGRRAAMAAPTEALAAE